MSLRRPTSAEPDLAVEIRRAPGICVLTGGQTGVDTAAARAALRAGLPVHLVFPRGFLQEDGPITPSRRRALRGATLHELTSDEFAHRTWTCVSLSDAVILIDPAGGDGCQETVRAARSMGKPLLSLDRERVQGSWPGSGPVGHDSADLFSSFIIHNKARVLMIAGCRASLLAAAGCQRLVDTQTTAIAAAARRCDDALAR